VLVRKGLKADLTSRLRFTDMGHDRSYRGCWGIWDGFPLFCDGCWDVEIDARDDWGEMVRREDGVAMGGLHKCRTRTA
jgi:hypothetical protein